MLLYKILQIFWITPHL